MKFKSLLLAAAVAAVSFSGIANAAIDGPKVNSDLVLFVYDNAKDLSYVQNLNVNYKDIIGANGSYSNSFNLNAASLNIFSGSLASDLIWGMAATGADLEFDAGSLIGSLFSSTATPTVTDYGDIAAQNLQFTLLADSINFNSAIGTSNSLYGTGASASVLSASVNAFSDNVSFAASFPNAAAVGTAQSLWFVHADDDWNASASSLASANTWVLDLGANTLSSAAVPVAPIPLPAAAWLMFSALMGLGGIARRRNAKV